MTSDRCPACGAATGPNAAWCSLCFADLRAPQAAPAAEVVAVAAAHTLPAEPLAPVVAPLAAPELATEAPASAEESVRPHGPQPRGASWPCHLCGEPRSVDENECPTCGAGLMPTDATPALAVPGLGVVQSEGQRVIVMVAGAFVVTLLLVVVMFIGGSLL